MNSIIKAASRLASRPLIDRALFTIPMASNRFSQLQKRWAHNMPTTYDFTRERIMLILHLYDKIDPNKLTLDSHFVNDLGLDSLDHVDIIMEIEDEFDFEIPDRDADKLLRPSDIVRYITDHEEAYKELQDLEAHDHHHGHGHDHEDQHHHQARLGEHSSHGTSHQMDLNHQKREFSSWTMMQKRTIFIDQDDDKKKWPTSFNEEPLDEVKFESVQERVMKVLSKYDKIDSTQLESSSHLVDDLGLDSLDHVEIMMELEDEFGLEIPDAEAEKLMRPAEIARYIFQREDSVKVIPEERPF